MERVFYVTGQRPAYGKWGNDLLKALDLGVEGAFVNFSKKLTATLDDDVTQAPLDRQPDAIRHAVEWAGCINVVVSAA